MENQQKRTSPRLSQGLLQELTECVMADTHAPLTMADQIQDRLRQRLEPVIDAFNDANMDYLMDSVLTESEAQRFRLHPVALSIRKAAGLTMKQRRELRSIKVDDRLLPGSPAAKIATTAIILIAAGLSSEEYTFEPLVARRVRFTGCKVYLKNRLGLSTRGEMSPERTHQLEKFADRFALNARPLTGSHVLEALELRAYRCFKAWDAATPV